MAVLPWFVPDPAAPKCTFVLPAGFGAAVPGSLQWAYDPGPQVVRFHQFIQESDGGWWMWNDAETGSQSFTQSDFTAFFANPNWATFLHTYVGDPDNPLPGCVNAVIKNFYVSHMTPPGPAPVVTPGTAPPAGTPLAQLISAMNAATPLALLKLTVGANGIPAWR